MSAVDRASEPNTTRVAIVTGGGSGIGLAISERLAADGAAVAVLDLNGAAAEEAAAKIASRRRDRRSASTSTSPTGPASRPPSPRSSSALGAPTILVNNAGLQQFGPFLELDLAEWQKILDVNLTGTYHCCQVVLPHMIEAGWGRIVNISSSSTTGRPPLMAAYVSAKSGVIGLTKSLALEFGPKGITVNTIPPGLHRHPDAARLRGQGPPRRPGRGPRGHARPSAGSAGPRTSPTPPPSS